MLSLLNYTTLFSFRYKLNTKEMLRASLGHAREVSAKVPPTPSSPHNPSVTFGWAVIAQFTTQTVILGNHTAEKNPERVLGLQP